MLLSDELLINYKRCDRRTYLEVYGDRVEKDPEKEFLNLLRRENKHHIQKIIKEKYLSIAKPQVFSKDWEKLAQETMRMMELGVNCIYGGRISSSFAIWESEKLETLKLNSQEYTQAPHRYFLDEDITFIGSPTLLIKEPGKSKFGDWQYTPINIKIGRNLKPEHKLIGAYHAQLLKTIQGTLPTSSRLILGDNKEYRTNLINWLPKMQTIVANCLKMLQEKIEPDLFISRHRCKFCHWYTHCYDKAKSNNHLSLVPGITPSRYKFLVEQKIDNLEEIALDRHGKIEKKYGTVIADNLKQQARSTLLNIPLVKTNSKFQDYLPELSKQGIELYLDIEAEPNRNLDYLFGILSIQQNQLKQKDGNEGKFNYFIAEHPDEEATAWQQFIEFILNYNDAPIFHFGKYEIDTIKRLSQLYQTPKTQTKQILSHCIDIHQLVIDSVILPVESYSLKSLAKWLGFQWRNPDSGGDLSVCWYDRWLTTGDRNLLLNIINYNQDDCYATYYLKNWLVEFLNRKKINI